MVASSKAGSAAAILEFEWGNFQRASLHLLQAESWVHIGGFNSPASQPTASVFKGSIGKETSSVRRQVLHSKVRRSNPRWPGEIRPKPILCLQVGHIGRSTVENELRISRTRKQAYASQKRGVCPVPDFRSNLILLPRNTSPIIAIARGWIAQQGTPGPRSAF